MNKRPLLLFLLVLAALALIALLAGDQSFTRHMLIHMGVVVLAAPFLALSLIGTRYERMRADRIMTPITASLVELVTVWFWHMPALRRLADGSTFITALELSSFLAAGTLLWLACLGTRQAGTAPRLAGVIGLLLTSMHMTLLGALLTLSPRPLYGGGTVTCFGLTLSAADDQALGGVVMLLIGAAAYLAGGVALLAGLLKDENVTGTSATTMAGADLGNEHQDAPERDRARKSLTLKPSRVHAGASAPATLARGR
ncbi:hypothetical protein BJF93_06875 [Xaviernesmea oryzae]|uniref:Cytochrome-c oxidase n=1 Tax=Xaviernesmea oryzae TaxID=464029 RepID=A0A1Q9ASA4_9HYPH|nr:cytochrome c oxidase assembly protein [Xaviernesmea oryzae]OLP58323.1 hypothetical protein BJF93_06875 [Xaviernesmea oryzae]SEL41941.1 Cytochrome c oxidase assembly factor CtaG [Xaviernesmea oryzae]